MRGGRIEAEDTRKQRNISVTQFVVAIAMIEDVGIALAAIEITDIEKFAVPVIVALAQPSRAFDYAIWAQDSPSVLKIYLISFLKIARRFRGTGVVRAF